MGGAREEAWVCVVFEEFSVVMAAATGAVGGGTDLSTAFTGTVGPGAWVAGAVVGIVRLSARG